MPTGYTNKIIEGCTFERFVWTCARAFGANVEMRDSSSDAKIVKYKVGSYHSVELKRAKKELAKFKKMTTEQIKKQCELENNKILTDYERNKTAEKLLLAKYEIMLERVQKWNPPSTEHNKLKDFMTDQIQDSIKFDCSMDDYLMPPQKMTPEKWINERIESAQQNIDYHTKEYREECERVKGRNNWNKLLEESVPQPK